MERKVMKFIINFLCIQLIELIIKVSLTYDLLIKYETFNYVPKKL
jgi:hypothetical protein